MSWRTKLRLGNYTKGEWAAALFFCAVGLKIVLKLLFGVSPHWADGVSFGLFGLVLVVGYFIRTQGSKGQHQWRQEHSSLECTAEAVHDAYRRSVKGLSFAEYQLLVMCVERIHLDKKDFS